MLEMSRVVGSRRVDFDHLAFWPTLQHQEHHKHGDHQSRRDDPDGPSLPAIRLGRPPNPTDRPGDDRQAGDKPFEIVRQMASGGIAEGRILFETFQANRLEIARHVATQLSRRSRFFGRQTSQRVDIGRAFDGTAAGQQFVKDHSQRINIRRRSHVVRFSFGLLGGHVPGRSQNGGGDRDGFLGAEAASRCRNR